MARGDTVFMTDADLSAPLSQYSKLLKHYADYDIVIGSRGIRGAQVKNNPMRTVIGTTGNVLIRTIVKGIYDTQCGFKLYKADVAKHLFGMQVVDGFGFDFEVLSLAQDHGYRIKEVPVVWVNAPGTKVKAVDFVKVFFEFLTVIKNKRKR